MIDSARSQNQPVYFALPSDTAGRCLQQIRVHPGITRGQLQNHLGLTQPTTARLVSRMEDAGIVRLGEPVNESSSTGRPSAGLYVDGSAIVGIGAHVGKRETRLILTNLGGATLADDTVMLDLSGAPASESIEAIAWRMARLTTQSPIPVRHIGFAFSADVSNEATVTSQTYGWDSIAVMDLAEDALRRVETSGNFAPQYSLEVSTGVAAMAAAELARTDLGDLSPEDPLHTSLYVYSREVLAYAWIIRGGIHRPRLGHLSRLVAQIVRESPLDEYAARHGIDPLSVSALAGATGNADRSLRELVDSARTDSALAGLMDHRADMLAQVISTAVDVVDPGTVILAGDTFSADPARARRIANHIRNVHPGGCKIRAHSGSNDITATAAATIALHAPRQHPLASVCTQ